MAPGTRAYVEARMQGRKQSYSIRVSSTGRSLGTELQKLGGPRGTVECISNSKVQVVEEGKKGPIASKA